MYNLSKPAKVFNKIAYSRNERTVFDQCLNVFLIPFKYGETAEELRELADTLKTCKNRELIAEFFTTLSETAGPLDDPLGEFFMEHISHGRMGQYFTPEPMATMMAMIAGNKYEKGQTVLDPACGSGRMLLAAAKINRDLVFYGSDIDHTCCKMALANMLMNTLSGEIAHMDPLSNKFYRSYMVTKVLIGDHYLPCYLETTNPDKSRLTLKAVKEAIKQRPVYVQGNLFEQFGQDGPA